MSVEVPAVPLPSATVDSAPSRAAILGHPIHPMLVPLPIGMLVSAAISDLVASNGGGSFWARASRLLLGGTLATGATAGAVGAVDFLSVEQARRPEGWLHATGNGLILVLTAVNLGLRGDVERVPKAGAVLTVAATALAGFTGWMGGELSYRYRVGVTPRRHGEVIGTNENPEAVPAP
jgi:uncharacterized membrane protein